MLQVIQDTAEKWKEENLRTDEPLTTDPMAKEKEDKLSATKDDKAVSSNEEKLAASEKVNVEVKLVEATITDDKNPSA